MRVIIEVEADGDTVPQLLRRVDRGFPVVVARQVRVDRQMIDCIVEGCEAEGTIHISLGREHEGLSAGYTGTSFCSWAHLAAYSPQLAEDFAAVAAEITKGDC